MPKPDTPPNPQPDLAEIFSRYKPELLRFLLRRRCRRSELEDITQEVFKRVLVMKDTSQIEDFRKYLPTVAWNIVKAARKRESTSVVTFDSFLAEIASESPATSHDVSAEEKSELRRDLIRASKGMSRQQKRVLKLRFHDHGLETIARRMSISRDRARRLIERAYAHMRSKW